MSLELSKEVLERFLRYVKIHTTSNRELAATKTPSTPGQWDLLRLLEKELKEIGVTDVSLDAQGYLIARIAGNLDHEALTIGFMAHVDTNDDVSGENVNPQVRENYDGKPIVLENGLVLDPAESPALSRYKGETIITADGTTLLGADDKAGIAEIMTAVHWLLEHPQHPRGDLEIIFTPDEETGHGMNHFSVDRLRSRYCYTLDGSEEGQIETECCYASKAVVSFKGYLMHPGSARGKMINPITMAGAFITLLPRNESPEATDGRYGYYWSQKVTGNLESAELIVQYRSFDRDDLDRKSDALRSFAAAVEASFPGGRVDVETAIQYLNMREELDKHPQVSEILKKAVRRSGIEPVEHPIRGGTDGALLTAKGIPTPNIFAGGLNFHSCLEWVALPAMVRAIEVILNLVELWALSGSMDVEVITGKENVDKK